MNATKNIQLTPDQKFIAVCDRVISVYQEIVGSDHPEASKLTNELYRGFGGALTAKRRLERAAAKVLAGQGDKS